MAALKDSGILDEVHADGALEVVDQVGLLLLREIVEGQLIVVVDGAFLLVDCVELFELCLDLFANVLQHLPQDLLSHQLDGDLLQA